jgi:hypothetical protein
MLQNMLLKGIKNICVNFIRSLPLYWDCCLYIVNIWNILEQHLPLVILFLEVLFIRLQAFMDSMLLLDFCICLYVYLL